MRRPTERMRPALASACAIINISVILLRVIMLLNPRQQLGNAQERLIRSICQNLHLPKTYA